MQGWGWRQAYGELHASTFDAVMMLPARRIGLECDVFDAVRANQGCLGFVIGCICII